jgi:transposase-like protein
MLSEKRDELAARAFFNKAIGSNGLPEKVTMDKSGANKAGGQHNQSSAGDVMYVWWIAIANDGKTNKIP